MLEGLISFALGFLVGGALAVYAMIWAAKKWELYT